MKRDFLRLVEYVRREKESVVMETKRLFDRDPYRKAFHAEVVTQEINKNGTWKVVLDKTGFYPESGGQPCDVGTLDGVAVLFVYEEGSTIYHELEAPLEKKYVEGQVDFERRFDHMQQHSGQHILSASFMTVAQYETVAFHLGKKESTIDLRTDSLTNEILEQVEHLTNQIVMENRHIETRFFSRNEVEINYLKKVPNDQEKIRMVHVTDFDLSACCGTHPFRTGELGLIKILGSEKHRGGMRVTFVCGYRALKFIQNEHFMVQNILRKLKTNQSLAEDKLDTLILELEDHKKQNRKYYQETILYEAKSTNPTYLRELKGKELEIYFMKNTSRPLQELKDLAKTLIEKPDRLVIFIHNQNPSAGQWILAFSDSVPLSVKDLIAYLMEQLGGNGGGSRVFGQWSGEWKEGQEEALLDQYFLTIQ
jgi:alanyl-tRNA synthetase